MPSDFNGDGYAEVATGASQNDANGMNSGAVYICLGGSALPLDCIVNATLTGLVEDERLGVSVSAVGDVNADGFADLLVGADRSDAGGADYGAAFLYLGGVTLDMTPDLTLTGEASLSYFGQRTAGPGDLNGDGYRDLAVSAVSYGVPMVADNLGRVYVYLGGPATTIDATPEALITGEAAGDSLGETLAPVGDVDGDGYSDLVVGAPDSDGLGPIGSHGGRAYLFRGGAGAFFDTTVDWAAAGPADAYLGNAAAGGDVDRDGFSDLVVAAYRAADGEVRIYNGGSAMDMSPDATIVGGTGSIERFGTSVACSDMNADGYSDLVVGASGASSATGRAIFYFGGAGAFSPINVGVTYGEVVGDLFGTTAGSAGDVSGDGYGDVLIGAPYFDDGGSISANVGRTYLFYGEAGAFADSLADVRITGQGNLDFCAFPMSGGSF